MSGIAVRHRRGVAGTLRLELAGVVERQAALGPGGRAGAGPHDRATVLG
jgi:hypothetical protein